MDLSFVDPGDAPVPPEEVRVRSVDLTPLPDGRRLRIQLGLTPFQQRPSLDVAVFDPEGKPVASTSIIEAVNAQLEFILHLRREPQAGSYRLLVEAAYEGGAPVDSKSIDFQLTNI